MSKLVRFVPIHSQAVAVAPATFDLFLIDGDIIETMCSIYGLFFYPLWAYRAACFLYSRQQSVCSNKENPIVSALSLL